METLRVIVRSAAQSEMYVTKMSSTFTKKQTDSMSSSLSGGRDRINSESKILIWIESFRNLYRRLRHQRLRAFFYMTPKFVAQFRWYTTKTTKRNEWMNLLCFSHRLHPRCVKPYGTRVSNSRFLTNLRDFESTCTSQSFHVGIFGYQHMSQTVQISLESERS